MTDFAAGHKGVDSLPAPLTSRDCDLRHFKGMTLEVERLRRSTAWRLSKRRPELAFYMLNLWMASWHEVPCASLEDDDGALCDLAMCDPDVWPSVREDVLRGWVKCRDGRLYHHFVSDLARESLGKSKKAKGAAKKRWGKAGEKEARDDGGDADAMRSHCEGTANEQKELKDQKEPQGSSPEEKNKVFFIGDGWSLDDEARELASDVGLDPSLHEQAAKDHIQWWLDNKPDARKTRHGWMNAWVKQATKLADAPPDERSPGAARAPKATPAEPPPLPIDGPEWWLQAAAQLRERQVTRWTSYWGRCKPTAERGVVIAEFGAMADLMRHNGAISEAAALLGYPLKVRAP